MRLSGVVGVWHNARHANPPAHPVVISDWLPDLADPGWREVIFAIVTALALYALIIAWRIVRLHRRADRVPPFAPFHRAAIQPYLREQMLGDTVPPAPAQAPEPPSVSAGAVRPAPTDDDVAWERPPTDFAERQLRLSLEREVEALREELDALRGAFASLREEVRSEVSGIKAQQSVSPFYRDAMQMALSGATADTIAERCGIARGEADLVVALVRGNDGIDDQLGMEGDDHGGRPQT